jgi:alcohol dehydrogenase
VKIRAAVLREAGLPTPYAASRPLAIEEVELDAPRDGEVRVRIHAAGLCHSDLSVIDGNRPRPRPMVLGHEAAGVVEELGSGVRDLAVGDHVVMVFVPSCGACLPCMSGRPALCDPAAAANGAGTLLSGERRLSSGGAPLHHHIGVSCFAEHAVVSRRSLVKVDAALPFEHAALFGCAVLTGVGAVINTAALAAGSSAAVVGLGGVGLAAILGAKVAGARQIVAIDRVASKLDVARALGATDTFLADDDDVVAKVREATSGGVDVGFEMAGSVRALDVAYRVTRRGGTTVTAGLSPPDHTFALPHVNLVAEERTLKGSYIGSAVPARDVPRYVALFQQGLLPVDRLVGGTISLGGINEAFDDLASGRSLRQILLPHAPDSPEPAAAQAHARSTRGGHER